MDYLVQGLKAPIHDALRLAIRKGVGDLLDVEEIGFSIPSYPSWISMPSFRTIEGSASNISIFGSKVHEILRQIGLSDVKVLDGIVGSLKCRFDLDEGLSISVDSVEISVILLDSGPSDEFSPPQPVNPVPSSQPRSEELSASPDTQLMGTKHLGDWLKQVISTVSVNIEDLTVRVYFRSETNEFLSIDLCVPKMTLSDTSSDFLQFPTIIKKKLEFDSIQLFLCSFSEGEDQGVPTGDLSSKSLLGTLYSHSQQAEDDDNRPHSEGVSPPKIKQRLCEHLDQSGLTYAEFCDYYGVCLLRFKHWIQSDLPDFVCLFAALRHLQSSSPLPSSPPSSPFPSPSSPSSPPEKRIRLPPFKTLTRYLNSRPTPTRQGFHQFGLFDEEEVCSQSILSCFNLQFYKGSSDSKMKLMELEGDLGDLNVVVCSERLPILKEFGGQLVRCFSFPQPPAPLPSSAASSSSSSASSSPPFPSPDILKTSEVYMPIAPEDLEDLSSCSSLISSKDPPQDFSEVFSSMTVDDMMDFMSFNEPEKEEKESLVFESLILTGSNNFEDLETLEEKDEDEEPYFHSVIQDTQGPSIPEFRKKISCVLRSAQIFLPFESSSRLLLSGSQSDVSEAAILEIEGLSLEFDEASAEKPGEVNMKMSHVGLFEYVDREGVKGRRKESQMVLKPVVQVQKSAKGDFISDLALRVVLEPEFGTLFDFTVEGLWISADPSSLSRLLTLKDKLVSAAKKKEALDFQVGLEGEAEKEKKKGKGAEAKREALTQFQFRLKKATALLFQHKQTNAAWEVSPSDILQAYSTLSDLVGTPILPNFDSLPSLFSSDLPEVVSFLMKKVEGSGQMSSGGNGEFSLYFRRLVGAIYGEGKKDIFVSSYAIPRNETLPTFNIGLQNEERALSGLGALFGGFDQPPSEGPGSSFSRDPQPRFIAPTPFSPFCNSFSSSTPKPLIANDREIEKFTSSSLKSAMVTIRGLLPFLRITMCHFMFHRIIHLMSQFSAVGGGEGDGKEKEGTKGEEKEHSLIGEWQGISQPLAEFQPSAFGMELVCERGDIRLEECSFSCPHQPKTCGHFQKSAGVDVPAQEEGAKGKEKEGGIEEEESSRKSAQTWEPPIVRSYAFDIRNLALVLSSGYFGYEKTYVLFSMEDFVLYESHKYRQKLSIPQEPSSVSEQKPIPPQETIVSVINMADYPPLGDSPLNQTPVDPSFEEGEEEGEEDQPKISPALQGVKTFRRVSKSQFLMKMGHLPEDQKEANRTIQLKMFYLAGHLSDGQLLLSLLLNGLSIEHQKKANWFFGLQSFVTCPPQPRECASCAAKRIEANEIINQANEKGVFQRVSQQYSKLHNPPHEHQKRFAEATPNEPTSRGVDIKFYLAFSNISVEYYPEEIKARAVILVPSACITFNVIPAVLPEGLEDADPLSFLWRKFPSPLGSVCDSHIIIPESLSILLLYDDQILQESSIEEFGDNVTAESFRNFWRQRGYVLVFASGHICLRYRARWHSKKLHRFLQRTFEGVLADTTVSLQDASFHANVCKDSMELASLLGVEWSTASVEEDDLVEILEGEVKRGGGEEGGQGELNLGDLIFTNQFENPNSSNSPGAWVDFPVDGQFTQGDAGEIDGVGGGDEWVDDEEDEMDAMVRARNGGAGMIGGDECWDDDEDELGAMARHAVDFSGMGFADPSQMVMAGGSWDEDEESWQDELGGGAMYDFVSGNIQTPQQPFQQPRQLPQQQPFQQPFPISEPILPDPNAPLPPGRRRRDPPPSSSPAPVAKWLSSPGETFCLIEDYVQLKVPVFPSSFRFILSNISFSIRLHRGKDFDHIQSEGSKEGEREHKLIQGRSREDFVELRTNGLRGFYETFSSWGEVEEVCSTLCPLVSFGLGDTIPVSSYRLAIKELKIIDHLQGSKYAFCDLFARDHTHPNNIRNGDLFDIRLDCLHLVGMDRPEGVSGELDDMIADAHLLPVEVKLDQDVVEFLRDFFSKQVGLYFLEDKKGEGEQQQRDVREVAEMIAKEMKKEEEEVTFYLQRLTFSGTSIKIYYNAKSLDIGRLLPGEDPVQYMNLASLEGLVYLVPAIDETAISGWECLTARLIPSLEMRELMTLLPLYVGSMTHLKPVTNVTQKFLLLAFCFVGQDSFQSMLVDGTRRTGDFSWSVLEEATRFTGRVAEGALYAMESVDHYISPLPAQEGAPSSSPSDLSTSPATNNYITTHEPVNAWEGFQYGFARLISELGKVPQTAAYSSEVYQQAGIGRASLAALRAIPVAFLKPMVGIAGLSALSLQGVSNHFTDPEVVRHRRRHYDS